MRPVGKLIAEHSSKKAATSLLPNPPQLPRDEPWVPLIVVHEDNTTCIIAVTTGKNPTMKTLERRFGVSLSWLNHRIRAGDYVIVHTRSHDMFTDIYTKGFVDQKRFKRSQMLTNLYTLQELEDGVEMLNPEFLDAEKTVDLAATNSMDLDLQYRIIRSGPNSIDARKKGRAVKQKIVKAKAKAKPKIKSKAVPAAVSHANVAGAVPMDEPARWFPRVDYHAANCMGVNEDDRCPPWGQVDFRRTYLLDSGSILAHENIIHEGSQSKETAGVVPAASPGERPPIRVLPGHAHRSMSGGQSHSIITFFYVGEPP